MTPNSESTTPSEYLPHSPCTTRPLHKIRPETRDPPVQTEQRPPALDEPPFDPEYDNPPRPQTPTAEQALLGALILKPHQAEQLALEIQPGDLELPLHETIWNAALELAYNPDQKLDALTLADHLKTDKQLQRHGGAVYLFTLIQACPLPDNAPAYAKQVRDQARLRELNKTVTKLRQVADKASPETVDRALADALDTIDQATARFGPTTPNTNTGLVDLTPLTTGGLPEPEPPTWLKRQDGQALFYKGKVNGIFGDPECGKTWLAQAAIVEALNNGGTAAMIDVDHNGPDHTAARLLLLGAHINHLANPQHFRYYEPEDAEQLTNAITHITTWTPDILLIDSLGEIFPMLGVSTNDSDELSTALRNICSRPATAGSCVITIDHLPKNNDARATGYAIGSIAKKRMIRGSYIRAEARVQPAPGQLGRITLRIEKDTTGALRKTSPGGYIGTFEIDSRQSGITTWKITREDAPITADGTFRPTHLMEQASRYIEQNDQCSFNDIKRALQTSTRNVQAALSCLITEGFVITFQGANRSTRHHANAMYREAEDDQQ